MNLNSHVDRTQLSLRFIILALYSFSRNNKSFAAVTCSCNLYLCFGQTLPLLTFVKKFRCIHSLVSTILQSECCNTAPNSTNHFKISFHTHFFLQTLFTCFQHFQSQSQIPYISNCFSSPLYIWHGQKNLKTRIFSNQLQTLYSSCCSYTMDFR